MPSVSDERIQPALHALLAGDAEGLRQALTNDPDLVDAAWNGNTLLEWATQPPHSVTGNSGELRLYQRNNKFSIKIVGRGELMNSRVHDSENTLPACVFMTHC